MIPNMDLTLDDDDDSDKYMHNFIKKKKVHKDEDTVRNHDYSK